MIPFLRRSSISALQKSMSSWLIWMGQALVGMSFSSKFLSYGRDTWCLFLCQKAVGRSEQTSYLSFFFSNFLISSWMFVQASCALTFLCFKSSLRCSRWGFGTDKVKGLGDRNLLEATNVSRFRTPKKLKLDWLAKGMSSDSFTISDERIQ